MFVDPILYAYYCNTVYISRNGVISNTYYSYMDNNTHIVYWVSNQMTNRFYTLKWNDRFIHANRKYVAYRNTDMLYVVDTNGNINWSHNIKYMSYIFRFANGDSRVCQNFCVNGFLS